MTIVLGAVNVMMLGVAAVFARRASVELEHWRRREETMRLLRWAAELAASHDGNSRETGVGALRSLMSSPLVAEADKPFVAAAVATASRLHFD